MEYFVLGWGNSFFFGAVFLGCEHIFSLGQNIFEEGVDNGVDSSYNISCDYGMWHSLVARIVRDDEAAGSNPVIPTIEYSSHLLLRVAFFVRKLFLPKVLTTRRILRIIFLVTTGCGTVW